MRKIVGIVAGLLLLVGCSNDEKVFEQQGNAEGVKTFTSFTATLDDVAGTRAYLDATSSNGQRRVFWEQGDVISVYSDLDTELKEYTLTSISEDNQATFTGEMVTGKRFYAVFAPDSDYSVDANDYNIVHFDSFILYHKDELTFTGPMVATTTGNALVFKQATGLIRISVGNIHQLSEVVFITKNGGAVGMSGNVNMSESQPSLKPDGYYSAHYIGGTWLELDDSKADIYFVIAPTVLENGFSIKFRGLDADGNEIEVTKSYNSPFEVKAGTISSFALVDVNSELQAAQDKLA